MVKMGAILNGLATPSHQNNITIKPLKIAIEMSATWLNIRKKLKFLFSVKT
jgi:hypothetical protein